MVPVANLSFCYRKPLTIKLFKCHILQIYEHLRAVWVMTTMALVQDIPEELDQKLRGCEGLFCPESSNLTITCNI